jgi:hypothetical protein
LAATVTLDVLLFVVGTTRPNSESGGVLWCVSGSGERTERGAGTRRGGDERDRNQIASRATGLSARRHGLTPSPARHIAPPQRATTRRRLRSLPRAYPYAARVFA